MLRRLPLRTVFAYVRKTQGYEGFLDLWDGDQASAVAQYEGWLRQCAHWQDIRFGLLVQPVARSGK